MSDTLPTLRQLSYLVAIAEHLHFGRAAVSCLVSQSTLSNGIQELERVLGAQLVERDRRRVLLTPVGQGIVQRSIVILKQAQDLVDMVSASARPLASTLRLGVIPTIAPFWFPTRLPKLSHLFPDLSLKVREGLSAELVEDLWRGRLDVALLALPYAADGLHVSVLSDDPFILAAPKDHVAAAKNTIKFESLALLEPEMLLLEEGHCLRQHVTETCHLKPIRTDFSATSLFTLVELVREGMGVTLLPKMAVDSGLGQTSGVQLVEITGSVPRREIGLVWPKNSARHAELELLAKTLNKTTR